MVFMSSIPTPDPSRQIAFHQFLMSARKMWLMDALAEALGSIEPRRIKDEIGVYVPADVQQILATAGIRDEHIFPTPVVLETAPTLIGYYRLLLGLPRKSFYTTASGMTLFKSMEDNGLIGANQSSLLPEFCRAMCKALAELVRQLSPTVTTRDVNDLPLLTLGPGFLYSGQE